MSIRSAIRCLVTLCIAVVVPTVTHAQDQNSNSQTAPTVIMQTTLGDMIIELDAERAPKTVENFLAYVDDGFYTDTVFHRVIEGFMIQGGGFDQMYRRKATRTPVSNEAYNGLRNGRYTIAMARTNDAHSATSQFFINSENNSNLDHTDTTQRGWGYTVFGKVIRGKEVVDTISQVDTGAAGPFRSDVPTDPIVILAVERLMPNPSSGVEQKKAEGAEEDGVDDTLDGT